jgi:hypothetical protein
MFSFSPAAMSRKATATLSRGVICMAAGAKSAS